MKNSQAWSLDIMIAIVIFIGTIFIFYSILSNDQSSKVIELKEEASRLMANVNITKDITLIDTLLMEDYDTLKKKLRIDNEFCIYLEDENGNLIEIREGSYGMGGEIIELGGKPCGLGLNAMEIAACQTADDADECDRVGELPGFVPPLTAERCCIYSVLGLCCP